MGIKKATSLRMIFLRFLLMLLIGLLGATTLPFMIMVFSTTIGITTYGNYSEIRANELAPVISATPDLTEIEIPMGIEYVLLDKNYQVVKTTMDDEELKQALIYATTGISDESIQKRYLLVTRENEYVVLQYYIGSQFTNEWMNRFLLSPDVLLYILIGVNCILVLVALTSRLSKMIRIQLSPLFEATEKISQQNLDFKVDHSKIKEFDELLASFSDMKTNLKNSIEKQWKTELAQKEQIAALAHDLKTPLTVIQGNADLMNETVLDKEQKIYVDYIIESSAQIQIYIKTLIDISRAAMGYDLKKEKVDTSKYIMHIRNQVESLCKTKKHVLEWSDSITLNNIQIDRMQLERAIMNIVNNAIEHSEEGKKIYSDFSTKENNAIFSITDEGNGFSNEALQHAQECFFMDDTSRTSRMHFGMGLYIASSIVKQHGGNLILRNSMKTKGAQVIITIPCN